MDHQWSGYGQKEMADGFQEASELTQRLLKQLTLIAASGLQHLKANLAQTTAAEQNTRKIVSSDLYSG